MVTQSAWGFSVSQEIKKDLADLRFAFDDEALIGPCFDDGDGV